jgi:hypothetical protein
MHVREYGTLQAACAEHVQVHVIYVPRRPAASFSARSASGQLEWAISTAWQPGTSEHDDARST